ncbi:MAG: outer membrane beta-barrel protein [Paludibacter sp.]
MKKKLSLLSLLFASIFSIQQINAQMNFEVRACGSLPQGDFSSNVYEQAIFGNSGSADFGFDIGIKLIEPIKSIKNLSFTISIDYLNNGLTQQFKDKTYANLKSAINNSSVSLNLSYPTYSNIPCMAGLNYFTPIDTKYGLYIDGGIGINLASVSDLIATAKYNGLSASSTISIKSSQALAGQIGAGFLFDKKISLGVNYNLLGTYSFSGTSKASNDSETAIPSEGKMSINTLNIYLGYRF